MEEEVKQAFYTFQEKTQQGQRPGEHGTAARELGTQHCSRRERAWWEAEGNKTGRLGSALCVLPVPPLLPLMPVRSEQLTYPAVAPPDLGHELDDLSPSVP